MQNPSTWPGLSDPRAYPANKAVTESWPAMLTMGHHQKQHDGAAATTIESYIKTEPSPPTDAAPLHPERGACDTLQA
jgi:hypothetical protein